jgi:uncharacterized membrane protein YdjX (TVP38/TMEM64 family)
MSIRKVLNITLAVIALVILWSLRTPLASILEWFSDREAVSQAIQNSGFWGPVILFLLFVLQTFIAFIPGQALMIASGYIYGFTGGLLITWISLVAGGQMAFWLARRYGQRFAEKWISNTILDRWHKSAAGQGIGFFAISLVLPLFPNDAMCYVAGLGRISAKRFLIANLLGRGMASFFTVLVGAYGSKIPVQVWVGAGVLIALGLLVWLLAKRYPNPFVKADKVSA